MSGYVLHVGRLAAPGGVLDDAYLVVEQGRLVSTGTGAPPGTDGPVVDLPGLLAAPGFIDVHVHGGGGFEVNRPTVAEVSRSVVGMARFHVAHGTTALLATTVSDSAEALLTAVEGVADVVLSPDGPGAGAQVLGSHLEGPWIAPSRAGAQYPAAIRPPSVSELSSLVARSRGTVRLVTLAPEVPGATEVVRAAASAGVVVSIGHTDADADAARAAFDAGARHVTHLFNAMPPVHHRRPGPVPVALADDRVFVELIADGVHVHPTVISVVAAAAPDRLVLITDAIGATGAGPGRYRLGPLEVLVERDRAVLADHPETVAGSVLTMDRAVAFAVNSAGVPLEVALPAASLHPATVLGETAKGRLAPGADADIVLLDEDLGVAGTIVAGRVAHDPGGLLASLAGDRG